MTLYLTDDTSSEDVVAAKKAGIVAFKLYPAGATTNSQSGVTDVRKVMDTLATMQQVRSFPEHLVIPTKWGILDSGAGLASLF